MGASFVVYIDESGDEGFRSPKSPQWFVLAAVITRAQHDAATVRLVDETRKLLGKQPTTALHFQKLDHKQRVPYINKIVEHRARLRAITVLIHKPSIAEVEWFSQKDRLYQYATRYLLERVSWFCRDHKERTDPDGSARITFSNRSNTSYDSIREYVAHLRKISDLGTERIELDWRVIRPEQIEAKPHQDRKGLQIVDAIASSFYFGVQHDRFGFTEAKYATMLRSAMYSRKGKRYGYGIKVFPPQAEPLIERDGNLAWLVEHYKK